MKNTMNLEQIIKLEELLLCEDKGNLTEEESDYVKRAIKIPYICLLNDLLYYRQNWIIIDEVFFMNYLKKNYMATEDEIKTRIKEVHKIYRYYNDRYKNQVKEQKKMIKKMINY